MTVTSVKPAVASRAAAPWKSSALIGRSLRAALDMSKLGENTLYVDCDVIQADGGTRTASITGAMVAVIDALKVIKKRGGLKGGDPLKQMIAAVSVGMYQGEPVLDSGLPGRLRRRNRPQRGDDQQRRLSSRCRALRKARRSSRPS